MKKLWSSLKLLIVFVIFMAFGAIVVVYYPWLFGKNVKGEIIEVERVTMPSTVIGSVNKFQMHSYAVLIQDDKGEMFTSSSEDRRWEVAKKGMCVVSLFYRHPPWRLQSAGTFYNARVQKIFRCPGKDYSTESNSTKDSFNDNSTDINNDEATVESSNKPIEVEK